ncbi:bacteriophage antitermination protein Q [Xenorhabdus hominickii]|uniref:Antitermination protein Q n=1 Tax=Xenorhabdus hominickii TaxID=351679 RepID=A0A2G0QGN9_XENHO|nr:bacteriophage antitermination protein Q [Xenorhabdus hominickii]AOM42391.1 hypothetical protein A9255_18625 [Xenorhabdus hominickii]PHM58403.1 antitermination protein Q [Xenorhabdus hominickii]
MIKWYSHDLQYVRTQIIPALADMAGETKGQLAAFEDSPLTCTDHYKRNKTRIRVGNYWVVRDTDPVFCPETRMRKQPKPPINPITYSLSSWRRAVLAMDKPKLAWVLYCYAHSLDYRYQVEICEYLWGGFLAGQAARRLSIKVSTRLKGLVWLAVQQCVKAYRSESFCSYTRSELAGLAGVSLYNWKNNYAAHWSALVELCETMDREALQDITRLRIEQKSNHDL